jgi:hypothetical protein
MAAEASAKRRLNSFTETLMPTYLIFAMAKPAKLAALASTDQDPNHSGST